MNEVRRRIQARPLLVWNGTCDSCKLPLSMQMWETKCMQEVSEYHRHMYVHQYYECFIHQLCDKCGHENHTIVINKPVMPGPA